MSRFDGVYFVLISRFSKKLLFDLNDRKKWFYSIVLSFFYSFVSLSLSTHQHVQFVVVKQTVSANVIRFAIMFSIWYDVVTLLTWIVIIHPFSILVWRLCVAAQMATENKYFAKFLSRFCGSFYLICRKYPEKIANFWASVCNSRGVLNLQNWRSIQKYTVCYYCHFWRHLSNNDD